MRLPPYGELPTIWDKIVSTAQWPYCAYRHHPTYPVITEVDGQLEQYVADVCACGAVYEKRND